ncbi:MAG: undecaprenyl-phosphate glucose phosphotransferase [Gammaproteobacteria bacterium]|jgi:putative colanic acid biosynthesis UDP-glucose lipid carrier transferase|uniref:undecaprenyl-phosphate glucose phosphotransferase n=1 Tax=Pseudomonas urmiensis TaxID=2745493 RepID=UPI0034D6CC46
MNLQPRYQPTFAERYPVSFFVACIDMLVVILAGLIAYKYRFHVFEMTGRYNSATLLSAVIVVLTMGCGGLYGSQRGYSFWRQVGMLIVCWLAASGILLALSFFLKVSDDYSRIWFATMLWIGGLMSLSLRLGVFLILRRLRSTGLNLKSVLLVDSGGQSASQLNRESQLHEYGFRIASTYSFDDGENWIESLVEKVDGEKVHEVWLCLPLSEAGGVRAILYALRHHMVTIRFIPEMGEIKLFNHRVSHIAGIYSLDLNCSPMDDTPARVVKRLEDLVVAGVICIFIIPVCFVIAVAIKLSSPGPVLFKQMRMGINGRKFKVYKFRSMVVHNESGSVTQATRNDVRITKVGAFLRRTSLDELPQFFNVLQGRMSVVGPRPHALAHNDYYKELVESYMQRHKVKPGITGWAQVSGYRGETDTLDKMQKRVEYDLWYIEHWSLWIDLKIIVLTFWKGFLNKNAF